ncbi:MULTISPECIES: hypothetical protein [unclassified Pseudomonas]|uniref:hypothetical protein n=1 Tax=unclassified Pseudomonas TaxID=196821 RepID=UPI0015A064F3|nr:MULTISPECIES: hypothetical protein [unclassified Pseudomonas]NWC92650.1 hypothetical protein [Pseudomonas sp. IPO3779]NWD17364.1 hypothetical protein [Pseudomonas sp. IPO3778]
MKLDREFQRRILEACSEAYPGFISDESWNELTDQVDEQTLGANFVYLYQHGLMEKAVDIGVDGHYSFNLGGMRCTQNGMDFLADDGGLGAVLGVVTIKIHGDTLREILERKILESDTPPAEKSRLVQGLKGLSVEATKHLTLKLLDKGLEHLPGAVALIGTYLQQNYR